MSCARQLPRTRSFFVVESGSNAPAPRGSGIRSSRHTIPVMVTWLALETLGRFATDVACTIAELLLAGLSWLLWEFLAGCAVYAEAMYPVQIVPNPADNSADQAAPVPPVTRPRLFIVSDATQGTPGDELPKQIAATVAVRDRTSWEPEIIRSARAPAARRKNRPR